MRETLPLRRPDLVGEDGGAWERSSMNAAREEMRKAGWQAAPAPQLDPRIPESLIPAETWVRPRDNGRKTVRET